MPVPHWGRFERRVDASNQTISNTAFTGDATQANSQSLSSVPEISGSSASQAVTAQLSVVSVTLSSFTSLSSSQQVYTLEGLGPITTVPRPTTLTFGSGVTSTAHSSIVLSDEASGDVSISSPATSNHGSISTYLDSYVDTSTVASLSTLSAINSTSSYYGWNATTAAGRNLTSVTTDVLQPSMTIYDPQTPTIITYEPTPDACDVTTNSNTVTVWSTIYTTTITWTLPPEEYTPPYPTASSSAVLCSETSARLSVSVCEGASCSQYTYPAPTTSSDGHRHVNPTATAGTTTIYGSTSAGKAGVETITFWTTDKNPSVVFSTSEPPPDYGDPGTTSVQDHNTPDGGKQSTTSLPYERVSTTLSPGSTGGGSSNSGGNNNGGSSNSGGDSSNNGGNDNGGSSNSGGGNDSNDNGGGSEGGGGSGAAAQTSATTTAVTVIIQTTQVIINDKTFTDSPQSKTSTVVVGTDTFVINPSEVIGAGVTVDRPVVVGGIFIPTKTTTTVAGVEVVYTAVGSSAASGGSAIAIATIDGTTFTIGASPITAMIKGQSVTLGPGGIAFASQTIPIVTSAGATESAVLGGEMITAIGNSLVVIEGTTFTYGPGTSTITEVIDGDTILIGPSGVSVHGITLGGISAATTATTYEIVGGATITEVGGSAVVIDGTTYSIGAVATSAITTVIEGQTLTIGPSGVVMSSYTFAQPYATSTVINPGGTSSVAAATETAESAGRILQLSWDEGMTGMCIAIGVSLLGGLLL